MPRTVDKYGIPSGGDPYPGKIKFYGPHGGYQLSWEEMVAAVARGGWPESLWPEAVATAAAESDRKLFIYNTYKSGHFGVFQISREAHGEFFAPGGNGINWIGPWANAAEAYRIYQSQGWKAWQGHGNAAYLAALPAARAAVLTYKGKVGTATGEAAWLKVSRHKTDRAIIETLTADPQGATDFAGAVGDSIGRGIAGGANATAEGVTEAGGAVASTVAGMASVVTGLWEALTTPAFWMRVAYGTTGVVLIAGGLFLVVRNTAVDRAVTAVAKGVGK